MSQDEPEPSIIDDALAEIAKISFQEPAICTSWVLVSEWFDGVNDYWVMTLTDDIQPQWRQLGLVHQAIKDWDNGNDRKK